MPKFLAAIFDRITSDMVIGALFSALIFVLLPIIDSERGNDVAEALCAGVLREHDEASRVACEASKDKAVKAGEQCGQAMLDQIRWHTDQRDELNREYTKCQIERAQCTARQGSQC